MSNTALVAKNVGSPVLLTPDNYIAMAIEKGADIDQLEKLMNLKERYDAGEAKSAFFGALSEFQSKVPVIEKTKAGHNYKYATLGAITSQIRDILKDCGLTYRFEQSHENGITVTCVITHIQGHSERTTMTAQADKTGSKNEVQAIGSTVTYLQRYTLIGALGISTADSDTDGVVDNNPVSGSQYKQLAELFAQMGEAPQKALMGYIKCQLEEVTADNFEKIKAMMERKIAEVKG